MKNGGEPFGGVAPYLQPLDLGNVMNVVMPLSIPRRNEILGGENALEPKLGLHFDSDLHFFDELSPLCVVKHGE